MYLSVSTNAIVDPALKHFAWSADILKRMPKPWVAYIHKVLYESIKQVNFIGYKSSFAHVKSKILIFSLSQKREIEKVCLKCSKCMEFNSHQQLQLIQQPIGSIIYENYYKTNWGNIYVLWEFQLDVKLRLNLTSFYIDIKDFYRSCTSGNLSIYNRHLHKNDQFTFCGRHPMFTHYTSSSNTHLILKFVYDLPVYFVFQYSIMSRNIISNEVIRKGFQKLLYIHKIDIVQKELLTFHIYVTKFKTVCININNMTYFHYTIIDGPSFLERHFVPNAVRFCASTFQLILQTYTTRDEEINPSNLQYYGVESNFSHKIVLSNINKTIKIPGFYCPKVHSMFCILQFETTSNKHVNLTLLEVLYTGMSTTDCIYGGIAAYDNERHILDICDDYGTYRPHRYIYSTNSTLMLVIYTYPAYSSLEINMNISTTICQPIQLNICEIAEHCSGFFSLLVSDKCVQWLKHRPDNSVFQLKSSDDVLHYSLQVEKCAIIQAASDFISTYRSNNARCFAVMYPETIVHSNRVVQITTSGFSQTTEDITNIISSPKCFTPIDSLIFNFNFSKTCSYKKSYYSIQIGRKCSIEQVFQNKHFYIYKAFLTPLPTASYSTLVLTVADAIVYNIDINIAYFRLRHTEHGTQFELLNAIGKLKRPSIFNYETLVIRLKSRIDCLKRNKTNLLKRLEIFIISFNYFNMTTHQSQMISNWKIKIRISCLEPVFYVSIPGYFSNVQYIMSVENISAKVEALWIKGILNANCSLKCCTAFTCLTNAPPYNSSFLNLPNDSKPLQVVKQGISKGLVHLIFRNYGLSSDRPLIVHERILLGVLSSALSAGHTMQVHNNMRIGDESLFLSWNSALLICKRFGGHLPVFNSRKEIEEFVSILKDGHFPLIEALFIGLHMDPVFKVSINYS